MSQHDGVLDNQPGAALRADLNDALAAIFTNHSGASAPSVMRAYQWWADTSAAKLKMRNSLNTAWVEIGALDVANLGGETVSSSAAKRQNQTSTYAVSGGSSTVHTLALTPTAISRTNLRFVMKVGNAPSGSPTLNVDSTGASNWKYRDASGNKQFVTAAQAPLNYLADNMYDGTDWLLLNPLPASDASTDKIQPITASVAANALTITLNPTTLDFRDSTLSSGSVNTRAIASAISVVVSSGSTLGTINAVQNRLAVIAIDNAGTVELAVANLAGGVNLDETGVISTTAEGGVGAADSATVIYSTTARTNVAYRVVGFIESIQATAGTWVTAPSKIQGAGGVALDLIYNAGHGQTLQTFAVGSTRVVGTTYYNTEKQPITIFINAVLSTASITIDGNSVVIGNTTQGVPVIFPVPAESSYSFANGGTTSAWKELRT